MKVFDYVLKDASARLHIAQNHPFDRRPTLIFLHDSLGCITLWRDFPQLLAEQIQCNTLVYDRQGYGKAAPFPEGYQRNQDYLELQADVLIKLVQELNIQNPILFGHSDGGSISLIAAAKAPDMFQGVITEGAHVFVDEMTLKGVRQAVISYNMTNIKEKLAKYHGDKVEALYKAWTQTWLSDAYRSWNIEHFMPQIKCPTLAIQGEEDEYGEVVQVDAIVSQVSGKVEKLMIPKVGHSPHKEDQATTLKEVLRFLREGVGI